MSIQLRTAIIESQVLFAKALAAILSEDPELTVVGEYRTPHSASLSAVNPDLILIDLDGQHDFAAGLAACVEAAPKARGLCPLHANFRPRPCSALWQQVPRPT